MAQFKLTVKTTFVAGDNAIAMNQFLIPQKGSARYRSVIGSFLVSSTGASLVSNLIWPGNKKCLDHIDGAKQPRAYSVYETSSMAI